jgi:hypothetical protein
MLVLAFPNPFLVAFGCLVAGLALAVGHYLFMDNLNRTQAYVWGVASLLAGFFTYCLFIGPATPVEIFIAFCLIAALSGALVKVFYIMDARFGWETSPDTTRGLEKIARLEKEVAERDAKVYQLELIKAQLKAETERLNGTPLAVFEWQRQEVVAAASACLEIMSEVSNKVGIVYGHMASIQGVFVNKGALNLSARQLQSLAQARSTLVKADTRPYQAGATTRPAQAGATDNGPSSSSPK